ncbi:hypothetical protein AMK16_20240 [Streptomyces sp. CB00455]|uniref:hypothetical protein n=1 Tax=Streptomyces sp. CB00455 TaxID=1703927 RepID=UPI00093E3D24|nr:hypothetical protein [Streptomyces sp. CB00455]OKK17225.1 hypothetical protein AMK16_20240 [Streptomyces sp. CB00455]
MTALLASLGGRLAERWLAVVVLPGVLYVCAVAAALELGHAHATDAARLRDALDRFAVSPVAQSNGALLLTAAAVGAGALAAGGAARCLGRLFSLLWTEDWGRLGAPLARRRKRRWTAATLRYEQALREKARILRGMRPPRPDGTAPDTAALAAARDRIALTEPRVATWMGDRMRSADARVRRAYDLDLATVWPCLWLTLSEEARIPLAEAQAVFSAAARSAGWGALYLVLGLWWWPAAPAGAAVVVVGWWRGREAVEHLARLVEHTVDLNTAALAEAVGHRLSGPFTPADGAAVTRILRKAG